jgi:hypothetical protein
MQALLQGYLLDKQTGNLNDSLEFYLKIRSQAPKQFNVMVLSDAETQLKQHIRYAVLSSQFTAAFILLIWIGIQNWLARSKIFITVMISVPLFVLSRLNYFGLFLTNDISSTTMYLNLNMVLFLSLIAVGTLMLKEGFGRLFSSRQNRIFLIFFSISFLCGAGFRNSNLFLCFTLSNTACDTQTVQSINIAEIYVNKLDKKPLFLILCAWNIKR